MSSLGKRLREVRKAQARTLREIAEKSGLTVSYLSQVENGRVMPPLASLKRLSAAYGLSLVELLADDVETDHIVLRPPDRRLLLTGRGGVVKELLVARQSGKRMEPILATIEPGAGSAGLYDHAGEEFGLVLSGRLELTVEDKIFHLRKGDAFYFSSIRPHGFRNPSQRAKSRVLWVITPPTY